MKVYFRIPVANVEIAYITMENQNFAVRAIADWCSTQPSVAADATYAYFWLKIDKLVQGAGDTTAGAASVFEILEDDKIQAFSNLQNVTVAKFEKGVSYLIPVATPAPLQMIPNFWFTSINNGTPGTNEILTASHYRFDCAETIDILNGTSISNCITCQWDGQALERVQTVRAVRKTAETLSFGNAIGSPAAQETVKMLDNGTLFIAPSGDLSSRG